MQGEAKQGIPRKVRCEPTSEFFIFGIEHLYFGMIFCNVKCRYKQNAEGQCYGNHII